MAENNSTLKHYTLKHQGNHSAFMLTDEDGQQFRAAVNKQGITINFNGYDNPSAEVMRETVEVMRELVARYDELDDEHKTARYDKYVGWTLEQLRAEFHHRQIFLDDPLQRYVPKFKEEDYISVLADNDEQTGAS